MSKLRSKPASKHKPRQREASDDDFVSVARRLGADEDKERFEAKLKKIATAKPKASK